MSHGKGRQLGIFSRWGLTAHCPRPLSPHERVSRLQKFKEQLSVCFVAGTSRLPYS